MLRCNHEIRIETAHLPKLEGAFINYILDGTDILSTVRCAVEEAADGRGFTGDALCGLGEYLRDEWAEINSEVEDAIEGGDRIESPSEYMCGGTLGDHILGCFEVTVTETVENTEEPDYETVAIRLLGAWFEHVHGGLHEMHAVFTGEA